MMCSRDFQGFVFARLLLAILETLKTMACFRVFVTSIFVGQSLASLFYMPVLGSSIFNVGCACVLSKLT